MTDEKTVNRQAEVMNSMKNLATVVLTATLITWATSNLAQTIEAQSAEVEDDDSRGWWQVEVIIFTQGNNSANSSEVWPSDVEISYPNQWQELLPFNDPSLELDPEVNEEDLSSDIGADSPPVEPNEPLAATEAELEKAELEEEILEEEKPTYDNSDTLYLLSEEEQQLGDIRNRLSSNGQRRVLFHQAWRQAMVQYEDEEPILITGGDQFDDHFELEGSVKIYWQRLLHFDTDLWLSEFSINAGQDRESWPELPRRPNLVIPTESLISLDQFNTGALLNFGDNLGLGGNSNQATSNSTFTDNTFTNPAISINSSNQDNRSSLGQINPRDWLGQRGNTTFYDSRYDEILSRSYVVNNLVTLKQDRPMRSNELHYIDHPQLGILVKIISYEEPEEEELEGLEGEPNGDTTDLQTP